MESTVSVYLFGDQTYDVSDKLRRLLLLTKNPILNAFHEQSHDALQTEISQLRLAQRQSFPRFANIAELLAKNKNGDLHAAFQTALTCIYQLSEFIIQHSDARRPYPCSKDSFLLGVCAGGIPAAAISCARSVSELLPLAVHAVAVSFRLVLCAAGMRDLIQPQTENLSWSIMVVGLSSDKANEVIDDFSRKNSLTTPSRPYITAYSPAGVTLSGPPDVLEKLKQSPPLSGERIITLPVFVTSHAPHLFSTDDVAKIMETTSATAWAPYNSRIPVVSCSSGKLVNSGGFKVVLQTAIEQCLRQPLRWDKINAEFPPILLQSDNISSLKIIPIGTKATLQSALREFIDKRGGTKTTLEVVTFDESHDAAEKMPHAKSKIAICGLAGRFPGGAESPQEFWDKVILPGVDTVKEVPKIRWDVDTHVDPTGKVKNTSGVPWGCWLEKPGLFDPRFFGISPKEAPHMDPAQRLALLIAYEAMEAAGVVPDATPSTAKDRIGVFVGLSSNDWTEANESQLIGTHSITGGIRPFVSGRMNYCHKFSGPSYTVDTACSSSLAAIQLAVNSLRLGDIDTAIAGGTNLMTNPDGHAALDRGFFLSRTGNCKTFDDGADGYCRGEGASVILLKRLADALEDGDPIEAIIDDVKTNHSAESDSITRPHAPSQIRLFDKVLSGTGTIANEISYIEMHGTGTQHGDAAEMTSVLTTFAPDVAHRNRDEPLYLGAAKSNVGHGEAVSGVTSVAKVLLMMRHNMIPPHCGIKTQINHTFPLDLTDRNVHIALNPTPWTRGAKPRKVLLNNFSAPGGNTAMILEDGPAHLPPSAQDERTSQIIAFSAKCGESLIGNMKSLLKFIDDASAEGDAPSFLPSLSYTTTARRQHHIHRACVTGSSIADVRSNLQVAISAKQGYTRVVSPPKIIFAFTGQGSQYIGMGKQLMSFSHFQDDIKRFSQMSVVLGFPSFDEILRDSDCDIETYEPVVVQLAIACLQMALARLWISWGVVPGAVVGHSLGEYAALNIAGVLSDADTIYLVGKRASLLQTHCQAGTHGMLAVRSPEAEIRALIAGKGLETACVNGPTDLVLGGEIDKIDSLKSALAAKSIKATAVRVQYAFHTSQVEPLLSEFSDAISSISFKKPQIPVISPLLRRTVSEDNVLGADYLVRHCRETVNMNEALRSAHTEGKALNDKSIVIEIGPQPWVSAMVNASLGSQIATYPSLRRGTDLWPLITTALAQFYRAGHDIKWNEWHRDFKQALQVLSLPSYSWDLKDYWIPYVNDWQLRKGDALPTQLEAPQPPLQVSPFQELSRPTPKIESSTVHRIVKEESDDKTAYLLIESDITRPDLLAVVQGHFVNGIPLCTPSVYADIALTVGKYLLEKYQPDTKDRLIDVAHMEVERALIAKGKAPQLIRASARVNWKTGNAAMSFFSVDAHGKSIIEHATCQIAFCDDSQLKDLLPKREEQLACMEKVAKDVEAGKAFRLPTSLSYKMIAGLANFHKEYRTTGEISLNGDTLESMARASFSSVKEGGTFSCHPAFIDGFTQVAGFALNAKATTDLAHEVFVNRGWDSLQIYKEVSPTAYYRMYVKMARFEGTMYKGDVIVLDDEGITVSFRGVALRGIPRKAFDMVINAANEGRHLGDSPPASTRANDRAINSSKSLPIKSTSVPVKTTAPTPKMSEPEVAVAQVSAASRKPKSPSKYNAAIAVILEETGLSGDEISDDSAFADMGVDSLLSMVINSRFKEELELDIEDESNSIFITYPTLKHFKDLLLSADDVDGKPEEEMPARVTERAPVSVPPPYDPPTPPAAAPLPSKPQPTSSAAHPTQIQLPPTTISATHQGASGVVQSILCIIADETGVDIADLNDACHLADVGVDSLLSMVIASRIREELDLELESDSGLFVTYPTVKHIRDFCNASALTDGPTGLLTPETEALFASTNANDSSLNVTALSDSSAHSSDFEMEPTPNSKSPRVYTSCRPATSVIIQGFPRTAAKVLFLLPDGGGSSSSYVPLPRLETNTAIIGLNCPYARDPENMTCHISDLMAAYVTEIKRRQPQGPYHIGGWSSGGVMAYIAVKLLIESGDDVRTLLILDSPRPGTMDKLPPHFYHYCKGIGLFGATTPPPYLEPHFDATVDVLEDWETTALPASAPRIKLGIIWAAQGVADGKGKPEFPFDIPHQSVGMDFMISGRTDFGPAGWETLVRDAEVVMGRVEGNHFSMMQKPAIAQVSKFIDRVMA